MFHLNASNILGSEYVDVFSRFETCSQWPVNMHPASYLLMK
jgi:hypothetical protein